MTHISYLYDIWCVDRQIFFESSSKTKILTEQKFKILQAFDYNKNPLLIRLNMVKCVNGIHTLKL